MRPFLVSLCNKAVTSCFFDKVFGTLTRRFAAPSPRGRGTFCRRVLLPLGEGGPKGRMRALVAASPRYVFVPLCLCVPSHHFYRNASFNLRSCSALIPGPNRFSKNPSLTRRSTTRLSTTLAT